MINPQAGLAGELEQRAVGRLDRSATRRTRSATTGRLHRDALPAATGRAAAAEAPSYDARQGRRPRRRHDAQQRAAARRAAARRGAGATGPAKARARHDRGLGRQLRPHGRGRHRRPGRRRLGGAQGRGGEQRCRARRAAGSAAPAARTRSTSAAPTATAFLRLERGRDPQGSRGDAAAALHGALRLGRPGDAGASRGGCTTSARPALATPPP